MRRTVLAVGVVALLVTGMYGCAGMQDDPGLQQQVQDYMAQQTDVKTTGQEGEATVTEETDVAVAATGAGPGAEVAMLKKGKHFEKFKMACFVEKAFWYAFDKMKDTVGYSVFNYDTFNNYWDGVAKYFQDAGVDIKGPFAAYGAVAGDSDIDKPYVAAFATDMNSDADKVWYFAFLWETELSDEVAKKVADMFFYDSDGDYQYDKFFYDGVGFIHMFSNGDTDVFTDFFAKFKGKFIDFGNGDQDLVCSFFPFKHYDAFAFAGDKPWDAVAYFDFTGEFAKAFSRVAWAADMKAAVKLDAGDAVAYDKVSRGFYAGDDKGAICTTSFDRDYAKPIRMSWDFYAMDSGYDIIEKAWDGEFAATVRFPVAREGDVKQLAPAAGERIGQ
jgi:hypothetical protein